jgi:hypothetical protein
MTSASHPTVCDDASLPVGKFTATPPAGSMKMGHDNHSSCACVCMSASFSQGRDVDRTRRRLPVPWNASERKRKY